MGGFTGEGAEAKMYLRRSAVPEHRIRSKTEYRAQDLLPIPSDFNAGGSGANVQSLSVQSLDTMPLRAPEPVNRHQYVHGGPRDVPRSGQLSDAGAIQRRQEDACPHERPKRYG